MSKRDQGTRKLVVVAALAAALTSMDSGIATHDAWSHRTLIAMPCAALCPGYGGAGAAGLSDDPCAHPYDDELNASDQVTVRAGAGANRISFWIEARGIWDLYACDAVGRTLWRPPPFVSPDNGCDVNGLARWPVRCNDMVTLPVVSGRPTFILRAFNVGGGPEAELYWMIGYP